MDTYEQKYKEALERAKDVKNGPCPHDSSVATVEYIFPELAESEDEEIYREIYFIVHHSYQERIDNLISPKRKKEQLDKWGKVKAWLERQKEQEHICDSAQYEEGFKTGLEIGLRKQKEQKPAGWSEEDEEMFEAFMHKLEVCDLLTNKEVMWAKLRLKSIRPSWKPSEEQMNALRDAVIYVESSESNFKGSGFVLESLYEQLKKL